MGGMVGVIIIFRQIFPKLLDRLWGSVRIWPRIEVEVSVWKRRLLALQPGKELLMSPFKKCLTAFAMLLCATPSFAGYLAGDTSSYFDGFTQWNGSTPFSNGGDLNGNVEWAVYAPGTFPGTFTGYIPNPAHVVYTYQLFEIGSDALSYFQVALGGEGYNADFFTGSGASASVDGQAPLTSSVTSFSDATWTFPGMAGTASPGTPSKGLVFTSPNVPENGLGIMQDGGDAGFGFPIPSPSPFFIPEPTTWTMALAALAGLAAVSLRRRRRRVSA